MSREPLGDQAKRHGGSVIVQRTARCRIDRVGLSTIVAKRRSRVSRVESDLTRKGNSYCSFSWTILLERWTLVRRCLPESNRNARSVVNEIGKTVSAAVAVLI